MIGSGEILQERYRIDRQIGQGGMGAVYVATDERFNSIVAIKETLCMDDNFRKAIEREARLLNSLKHTALPRVSDHFEESESQFLVMEYIPGDDVAAMLEGENSAFSTDNVLKWADQLLDALDYLHNQEIPVIHRDIKPQNLKLNSRNEVVLLDFGLAKGNPTDAGHQTAAKSIFGYSRNYASLEQIQGTGTDPRSDLYSLAATLYHMLTGRPPEDALTRAMAVLSNKPDPLVPANLVEPKVTKGVAGLLQKALDLNASERPASAAEMRQMLRDNEKFAYLSEPVDSAVTIANTRVFAQPTKLMADGTNAGRLASTEMKTEVFPTENSELTAVGNRPASFAAPPGSRFRKFGLFAGAAVLLLTIGAVAGGLFIYDSSMFGGKTEEKTDQPVQSEAITDVKAVTNAETVSNTDQQALTATADSGSDEQSSPDGSKQPKTTKPAEIVRTEVVPTTGKAKDPEADEVVEFTSDDPDIPASGVTVRTQDENGRVTLMKVNRPRRPTDQGFPPRDLPKFPPGFDPKNLTPEQMRRLKRVMRNNVPNVPNIPTAPPKDQP